MSEKNLAQITQSESGNMHNNLRSLISQVMDGYLDAKSEAFAGNPMANLLRKSVPDALFRTGFISPATYVVTGSAGQGNWATVPWIGIFQTSITSSATKGVYIVYLFSSDCESVYLTFNQGCTDLKNEMGKAKAIEAMRIVTEDVSSRIDANGFGIGAGIDLKDTHELPILYEKGTIFYKAYHKGNLPPNEEWLSDLRKMIGIYEAYLQMYESKTKPTPMVSQKSPTLDVLQKAVPEVSEEQEKTKMTEKQMVEQIKEYISSKGFSYGVGLIENFYLSLKSKPFMILAGISGTGKTKLAKLFAEAIQAPFKLVPVRPDWSDSTDLFGHLDLNGRFIEGEITGYVKKALENPDVPHFLCLDEMNLARVEYYLSDFLSVMETRERKEERIVTEPLIRSTIFGNSEARDLYGEMHFPENLYVIGTVNMDETTFPFSRKVLDRANTIEFSYVDLIPQPIEEKNVPPLPGVWNSFLKTQYLKLSECDNDNLVNVVCAELQAINEILQMANAHVGYRVRDEVAFYMLHSNQYQMLSFNDAFDNEIMQKILPRIQGGSGSLKEMLLALFEKCAGEYSGLSGASLSEQMTGYLRQKTCKYRKSAEKIAFMMRRFEEDGFASYWL